MSEGQVGVLSDAQSVSEDRKIGRYEDKPFTVKGLPSYPLTLLPSVKRSAFTLAEGATHVAHSDSVRKSAFTLAEVLITLGIIGVVAALTIPTLIQNYKKSVVETRLRYFYSAMNQAIALSEVDNGPKTEWVFKTSACSTGYEEECITNFFNTYLKNYLKYTKAEYSGRVLYVYFANGSVVAIAWQGQDYTFFTDNKTKNQYDYGKSAFLFGLYPTMQGGIRKMYFINKGLEPYVIHQWDGTHDGLYKDARNYTKIIQLNDWKIPKDYPIKF